jgi:hypothetical protein
MKSDFTFEKFPWNIQKGKFQKITSTELSKNFKKILFKNLQFVNEKPHFKIFQNKLKNQK